MRRIGEFMEPLRAMDAVYDPEAEQWFYIHHTMQYAAHLYRELKLADDPRLFAREFLAGTLARAYDSFSYAYTAVVFCEFVNLCRDRNMYAAPSKL